MAFQANVLRVLIASPSDVEKERDEIEHVIYKWNNLHSKQLNTVLLPIRWEIDVTPGYNDEGSQTIINEQIVNECDILIGVFWTKFGTPTASKPSGTIEEIDIFIKQKKEIMLYFVDGPIPRDSDLEEIRKIDEYKKEFRKKGIAFTYNHSDITNHLYKKVLLLNENVTPLLSKNLLNDKNKMTKIPDFYYLIKNDIFLPIELLFLQFVMQTGIREFDSSKASTLSTLTSLNEWVEYNLYDDNLVFSYNQIMSNLHERGILTPVYHPDYDHVITYKIPLNLFDSLRALKPEVKTHVHNVVQEFSIIRL